MLPFDVGKYYYFENDFRELVKYVTPEEDKMLNPVKSDRSEFPDNVN